MEIILDESNAEPLSEDKVSGAQCPLQTLGPCTLIISSGLTWVCFVNQEWLNLLSSQEWHGSAN